jgi:hypothetical protein
MSSTGVTVSYGLKKFRAKIDIQAFILHAGHPIGLILADSIASCTVMVK